MTLRIKDWDKLYENSRSRQVENARWIAISNSFDDDIYCELVEEDDGPAMVGCHLGIIKVASKCHPRGTLNKSTGQPHTSTSLARILRFPEPLVAKTVLYLVNCGFMEDDSPQPVKKKKKTAAKRKTSPKRQADVTQASPERQSITTEGMEWNGRKEENGKKEELSQATLFDSSQPFTTAKQPTPHEVLMAYDAIYKTKTGDEYVRLAKGREYDGAKRLIEGIAEADKKANKESNWQRIPDAMEMSFDHKWCKGKGFSIFVQNFQTIERDAEGAWDMVKHVADLHRGDS